MSSTFRAARHHYDKNHRDSIAAAVRPAIIEAPGDREEHGVVLSVGSSVRLVFTEADARRITIDLATILLTKGTNP